MPAVNLSWHRLRHAEFTIASQQPHRHPLLLPKSPLARLFNMSVTYSRDALLCNHTRNADRIFIFLNPNGAPLCDPAVNENNINDIAAIKELLKRNSALGINIIIVSNHGFDALKAFFNDIPAVSFIAHGGNQIEYLGQKYDIVGRPDFETLHIQATEFVSQNENVSVLRRDHYYGIILAHTHKRYDNACQLLNAHVKDGLIVKRWEDMVTLGIANRPSKKAAVEALLGKFTSAKRAVFYVSGAIDDEETMSWVKQTGGCSLKILSEDGNSTKGCATVTISSRAECVLFLSELAEFIVSKEELRSRLKSI
jgi:trehalose-6-phosphatase